MLTYAEVCRSRGRKEVQRVEDPLEEEEEED
jgi:hypothetical protein